MNNLLKYPIDNLFKDKLEDYAIEPPAALWDNISKSIAREKNKPLFFGFFSRNNVILLLIIVTLIPTLWFSNYFIENISYDNTNQTAWAFKNYNNLISEVNDNLISNNNTLITIIEENDKNYDDVNNLINISQNNNYNKNNTSYKNNNLANNKSDKSIKYDYFNKSNNTSNNIQNSNASNNTNNYDNTNTNYELNQQKDSNQQMLQKNNITETVKNEHNFLNKDKHNKKATSLDSDILKKPLTDIEKTTDMPPPDDYRKRQPWTFGVHITPEIIVNPFYTDVFATNNNKYAYAYEISGKYDFSGFFIQSGLGILQSLDKLNFKVEYEKYQQTASYQDVQITGYDTIGGIITPIYTSNTINVYDTLKSTTIVQKSHVYNYLQIPFWMGYSHSVDRVKYFIKGGIAYNYLLNKNDPEIIYSDENANILDVSKKTPDRAKNNFNFLLAVGVDYKISNAVTFSIEPTVRIYTSSLYDRNAPGTKRSPYAIGLKYGLILTL